MNSCYLAIDVGSASVRAGIVDASGHCLAQATHPIRQFRPAPNFVEQSSDDIWQAAMTCARRAIADAGIDAGQVRGVGFDATCSLVAIGDDGQPVSVSPTGEDSHDIIMWMDHRAMAEAAEVEATGHEALQYIGGKVSPELEFPKLLWLVRNRPDLVERTFKYLGLADFMVARATGQLHGAPLRSICTQVCKWLYLAHESRWPQDLIDAMGMTELFAKPGMQGAIVAPGVSAGRLAPDIADALGLGHDVTVAVGLIDAHAGALGILGGSAEHSLAVIAGTSTCHIALSRDPCFVPGVWGPYFGAIFPDGWINEGGQSATGALIDHVLRDSAAHAALESEAAERGMDKFAVLDDYLDRLEQASGGKPLTRDMHVLDYHHGNRSPLADASLTGTVTGLTLAESVDDLALRYLATMQASAYGTRHIVEALNANGHAIDSLRVCGGILKNRRWLQEMADATGLPIALPAEPEAMLLGGAMLAATACGEEPDLRQAAHVMGAVGETVSPRPDRRAFHEAKYRVYRAMHADQLAYRKIMQDT